MAARHEELQNVAQDLERVKWYLWHGNVYCALEELHFVEMDLELLEMENEVALKLYKMVQEFHHYISVNHSFTPNYPALNFHSPSNPHKHGSIGNNCSHRCPPSGD
jgi:hypothetical protein